MEIRNLNKQRKRISILILSSIILLCYEYSAAKYGKDIFGIFYAIPNFKFKIWENDTLYHIEDKEDYPVISSGHLFIDSHNDTLHISYLEKYAYTNNELLVESMDIYGKSTLVKFNMDTPVKSKILKIDNFVSRNYNWYSFSRVPIPILIWKFLSIPLIMFVISNILKLVINKKW